MMKLQQLLAFTFIILCSITCSYSQNKNKKVIYKDLDGKIITKKKFNKIHNNNYYVKSYQDENNQIKSLKHRILKGSLSVEEYKSIHVMTESLVKQTIDKEKTIFLHFYSNNDERIIAAIKNNKYWEFIDKDNYKLASYLIGTKDSGIQENQKNHVYISETNELKSLFFKETEFEINHLFIKPDGTYQVYYGDYDILFILDFGI